MSEITLQLPDSLAADLQAASRESKCKPDDLAVDLLRRALAVRKFRAVRQAALESLGDDAPATDEDAFKMME